MFVSASSTTSRPTIAPSEPSMAESLGVIVVGVIFVNGVVDGVVVDNVVDNVVLHRHIWVMIITSTSLNDIVIVFAST